MTLNDMIKKMGELKKDDTKSTFTIPDFFSIDKKTLSNIIDKMIDLTPFDFAKYLSTTNLDEFEKGILIGYLFAIIKQASATQKTIKILDDSTLNKIYSYGIEFCNLSDAKIKQASATQKTIKILDDSTLNKKMHEIHNCKNCKHIEFCNLPDAKEYRKKHESKESDYGHYIQ